MKDRVDLIAKVIIAENGKTLRKAKDEAKGLKTPRMPLRDVSAIRRSS